MDKKEELLSLFTISLALVACSAMLYMSRSPSLAGSVVLTADTMAIGIVSILILAGIAILIGTMSIVYNLSKETEHHRKALLGTNHHLAHYIFEAKKQGFKDEHIINKLKENKWKEKEIKVHLLR